MSALDLTVPPAYVELSQARDPSSVLTRELRTPKPEGEWQGSGWKKGDTALEAAFAALLLGDYLQTKQITKQGLEANPIIGKRGQNVPPELYFPAALALHAGAAKLLPNPWRKVFQGVSLAVQGAQVKDNLSAGYGFRF